MPNPSGSSPTDGDDMRWQGYEELVKDIYQALGQAEGVTVECWGSSCRVEGPPGTFHQIDVLTGHSDGLHQYRTAISCKYWNAKVGLPVVRELAQIIQDANLSKGVIVSKMGFTGPAKDYARGKNIELVELREPVDADWEGYVRKVHISLTIDQTAIHDIRFRLTAPKPSPGEQPFRGGLIRWTLLPNQIFIGVPGQRVQTLQELADEARTKQPDAEEYDLQFPEGSVLTTPDHPQYPAHGYSIEGMSFRVETNPPLATEIVVPLDGHIYMIMESHSDGRWFTVTRDGEIRETLPTDESGPDFGLTSPP